MAWTSRIMHRQAAASVLFLLAVFIFAAHHCSARVPKFVIGENFRSLYAKHHIKTPASPAFYRAYVTENARELLVEPRIQVVQADDSEGKKKENDVCEYKILPLVRPAEDNVTTVTSPKPSDLEDDADEEEREVTRGRGDDEYDDEEDEEEERQEELPFKIRPSKENKHEAVIETTKPLNCEHKSAYEFDIVAVSCAGEVSDSVRVEVKVEDVNEFEPKFVKHTYQATLEEGRLVDNILQVEAFDEDCSEEFSRISKYAISEAGETMPFVVDAKGVIRNTRPLNYTQEHSYFLTVVAYDAGDKKSLLPATVTITVAPACQPRWEGIPKRVEYVPDLSQVKLYTDAKLDVCLAALGCSKVEKITGHVTLKNDHIGKGCDREDSLPLAIQRKRCSSKFHPHSSLIELLPSKSVADSRGGLKMDSNSTALHGSNMILFDGSSTAIVLATEKLNPDMFNRSFTITTWLKRDAPVNRTYDHKFPKEHILCISDDHERSRHHVALYVRNCRLGLLIRREPHSGEPLTVFRPAEWRWNLDNQLCSGEWHHYAISVKYPDVKLFIDGQEFEDDSATEIIDDWALHPIKGLQTTTVVGACWQGSQNRMDQYLRGYLDGLSVLVNDTEEESVLQCMQKCAERLTVPDKVASSSQAVFSMLDSDENEMLVEGYDVEAFQGLIWKIGYENDRMYPTPGIRFVDIRTSFTCTKMEGNISSVITKDLPDVSVTLQVAESVPPSVALTGPTSLTIDGMENADSAVFGVGVKILDSLTISVMRSSSPALLGHDQKKFRIPDYEALVKKFSRDEVLLESCTLALRNEASFEDVTLVISPDLTKSLHMEIKEEKPSLHEKEWTIQGSGVMNEIPDFLTVLRDVRLKFNQNQPPLRSDVILKVTLFCKEIFSKVLSSKYVLEVDLKNFEHPEKVALPLQIRRDVQKSNLVQHNEELNIGKPLLTKKHEVDALFGARSVFSVPQFHGSDINHMTTTGAAITVVVVVCVSFFIFLVFVGVVKIRSIHSRTRRESEPSLRDVNPRGSKKGKLSLKNLRKLRKSLSAKRRNENRDMDEDEEDVEDVERGTAQKPKSDMMWDDAGMSITVNPLEEMQVGSSDCEYDDQDDEDDDLHGEYNDNEMTDEEKENDCSGHVIPDDDDSANECDHCTKPNRDSPQSPPIRRSQSCVETFTKSKDNRMTRSELEWDDQI